MSKTDELKFNTLPQEIEEDTNEENEHNKEQEKDSLKELEKENLKENDDFNTAGFEVIELYSDKVKSNFFKKLRKYYTLIGILVFLVLCLLVTTFFLFHGSNKNEDNTLNYNLERRRNDIEEANKKLNNKKSEPHKNNPPKKKNHSRIPLSKCNSIYDINWRIFCSKWKNECSFYDKSTRKK